MSGLREALAEIVADVPVYGDLDRAIEQAARERRRRHGATAGLAAAAAVLVVIAGILAGTRGTETAPPVSPTPTPDTPGPTREKSQSPSTWVDTALTPGHDGADWEVPDPLAAARSTWFTIVLDHLDPGRDRQLTPRPSAFWDVGFARLGPGSEQAMGAIGLMADRGAGSLFGDGCRFYADTAWAYDLHGRPHPSTAQVSCRTERFAGPHGEHAEHVAWGRRCGSYAPFEMCGDYKVAVAVARRDGRIGYVQVDGMGTPDANPFPRAAMAAAAADARLTLPEEAYAVPLDADVGSVVQDHFPGYRDDGLGRPADHPGFASAYSRHGRLFLSVTVRPAGRDPSCGRLWLLDCAERRVFGADDPTTVWVGTWDEVNWGAPKGSRLSRREFVYVGPRHSVVVRESMVVLPGEKSVGPQRDKRVIDLLLDPRLQ